MSAEVLRRAASLMRERAAMATPGTWRDSTTEDGSRYRSLVADVPHPDRQNVDAGGWGWDEAYGGCLIGESLMSGDRRHIASWHPVVALAVADWLDATAERIDAGRDPKHGGRRNHSWRGSREALAVARAYLGGESA